MVVNVLQKYETKREERKLTHFLKKVYILNSLACITFKSPSERVIKVKSLI